MDRRYFVVLDDLTLSLYGERQDRWLIIDAETWKVHSWHSEAAVAAGLADSLNNR